MSFPARVGLVGYGNMGRPMCINLIKAGFAVRALDVDASRVALMREDGVTPCQSSADLAGCDVVITMVWDDEILRQAVLGPSGLLPHLAADCLLIDMSTVTPDVSQEVAEAARSRLIAYLRAPVSGSAAVAQRAELVIYASGDRTDYDRCASLFAAISAKQLYVGTGEESRLLKLIINLLVLGSTALLGEALSFALRAGVDKNLCIDAINASIVGSPHYQARADLFKHEDLRSTGRWFGLKDIDMGMNQAAKVGAALPLMSLVHDQMRMTANRWPNANTLVGLTMLMRTINPPTAV